MLSRLASLFHFTTITPRGRLHLSSKCVAISLSVSVDLYPEQIRNETRVTPSIHDTYGLLSHARDPDGRIRRESSLSFSLSLSLSLVVSVAHRKWTPTCATNGGTKFNSQVEVQGRDIDEYEEAEEVE